MSDLYQLKPDGGSTWERNYREFINDCRFRYHHRWLRESLTTLYVDDVSQHSACLPALRTCHRSGIECPHIRCTEALVIKACRGQSPAASARFFYDGSDEIIHHLLSSALLSPSVLSLFCRWRKSISTILTIVLITVGREIIPHHRDQLITFSPCRTFSQRMLRHMFIATTVEIHCGRLSPDNISQIPPETSVSERTCTNRKDATRFS